MDKWDPEAIDLVEPGYIEFSTDNFGTFGFIVVSGWMDCRPVERNGHPGVEFSWVGDDEGDDASGRGWAVLLDGQRLEGHIFIHQGEDSAFRAEPFDDPEKGNAP